MRRSSPSGRPYFLLSLVYICVHLAHISLSCVLLLNGWSPKSVRERAQLADIAAMGVVTRSWEGLDLREDGTYSAEFRLLRVYKGHEFLRNVTSGVAPDNSNVYNISNFGSKAQCFADVEVGSRYFLFLTLYDGRLSGHYEDLFGAASGFTEEAEAGIQDYLGWDKWSSWSLCSVSCGNGRQQRSRDCPLKAANSSTTHCVGEGLEVRACNVFSCQGSHDLLTLMGVRALPQGVNQNVTNGAEYVITKDAQLSMSASRVYDVTFPTRFSLLLEVKVHRSKKRRYVFAVTDYDRKQQLAVFIGRRIKLQYLGNNYGFKADILDEAWHKLSFSVDHDKVTLHLDCDAVMSRRLRSTHQALGNGLIMSIGPLVSEYGDKFEGGLRQLVFSEDTEVASQQCGDLLLHEDATQDTSLTTQTETTGDNLVFTTSVPESQVHGLEWSPWSPCSVSCGQGKQSRQARCRAGLNGESCKPLALYGPQIRTCTLADCTGCNPACENGGICISLNRCQCRPGFSGYRCESKECPMECLHGGVCNNVTGLCDCPTGYRGKSCHTPVCQSDCENGGRCIGPDQCSCQHGYSGTRCEYKCSFTCHHGGECVGLNVCRCNKHYTGVDCSIPLCTKKCLNGGQCVSPNKCSCPFGYFGKRCQKAQCRPKCKNGGLCISPGVCLCKSGYSGQNCQHDNQCGLQCLNGGTCDETTQRRCKCPPGFFGRRCQREKCTITCLNGGRCKHSNFCRCPRGFSGRRCERRTCLYQHYLVPHRRTYRRVVRIEEPVRCAPWSTQWCVRTRWKYIVITRETYRPIYRCV